MSRNGRQGLFHIVVSLSLSPFSQSELNSPPLPQETESGEQLVFPVAPHFPLDKAASGFDFRKGWSVAGKRTGAPGALAWSEEAGSLLGRPKPPLLERDFGKKSAEFSHPGGEREGTGVPEFRENWKKICNV